MAEKIKKVRVSPFVGTKISTAKAEFELRRTKMSADIKEAFESGRLETVDYEIYAVRHLGNNTTVELMQSADAKKVGITNLNKRQLEAGNYMLIKGVSLLSCTDSTKLATANETEMQKAEYGVIPAGIANGELEIRVGETTILPRNSAQGFVTKGGNATASSYGERMGYRALDCPKIVPPLTDIVPTLYLGQPVENTAVKLCLIGCKNIKA